MTFLEIDRELCGAGSALITLARSWAERYGFAWAYSHGKAALSTLVGWGSPIRKLKSESVYDVIIDRLVEQCELGDDVFLRKGTATA